MKGFYSLLVGAIFSAAGAYAQEKIFSENFDSSDDIATVNAFGDFKLDSSSAAAAGSGKSLRISTIGKKMGDWPLAARFPVSGIDGGQTVTVKFSYVILGGNINYAIVWADGKRCAETTFSGKKGTRGQVFMRANIPAGKKGRVAITSAKGAEIAIDDIEIVSVPTSWLDDPKEFFTGMKFLPNNPVFAKPDDPIFSMSREEFFPFIDEYGQFKHRDWEDKIHSDADFQTQKEKEKQFNAKLAKIPHRSQYGGFKDDSLKAEGTGRFRLDKIDGKWTFRDPDGYPFWSLGIDCVNAKDPSGSTAITGREHYFEKIDPKYISGGARLYDTKKGEYSKPQQTMNFNRRNFDKKYGNMSEEEQVALIENRLRSWGFNSTGAWSNERQIQKANIPYCVTLGSARPVYLAPENKNLKLDLFWTKFPDYLHPDFAKNTKANAAKKADLINSPYCIGAFIDNELPWQGKEGLIGRALLSCPADQPSKIVFRDILKKKYSDISALNSAWKADYKDWEDFLARKDFDTTCDAAQEDFKAIEKIITDAYFTACRDAVKSVNPDALYLGCRFGFSWLNKIVITAAFEKCDVVTYNIYNDTPNVLKTRLYEGIEDKPVMIGEFHFGAGDRGNFWASLCPKSSSKERTKSMKSYLKDAIKSPMIIGAHWFQYADQYTTGRFDGENGALGFVDICDTPKYDMAAAMNEMSRKMYRLRFGK